MANQKWKMGAPGSILDKAAEMVRSSDTGVTLRQLFYLLVSARIIENKASNYATLSHMSAAARRDGDFPDLIDQTREVHQQRSFDDIGDAMRSLARGYKRDRTDGQEHAVYIGIEKHSMLPQLEHWFRSYGVPIITFGGFPSQTYVDEIIEHVEAGGRPSVFIYAGDLDPSGDIIPDEFMGRAGCFDEYIKIAVLPEQLERYRLVPSPFTKNDTRNAGFLAKYGALYQVEVEAIEPPILRGLYQDVFLKFFDTSKSAAIMEREERDRAKLAEMARRF